MIRVAITTDRFDAVAPVYLEAGLEPVPTPCVRIQGADPDVLERARIAVAGSDLVILTSARTIELLWPSSPMPPVDVAAVGPVTAEAVAAHGGRVVVTGSGGLAQLVEAVSGRIRRSRVVYARAAGSDPGARRRLAALAATLAEFEVYRALPQSPDPADVHAVSFASPSAVTGWQRVRTIDDVVVGVIGRTTAAAVGRRRPPDVVAPTPTHPALAVALASHLEVRK